MRGNLVFTYAVKTGQAAMLEAVLAQFPPDRVGGGDSRNLQCEEIITRRSQRAGQQLVLRTFNCV